MNCSEISRKRIKHNNHLSFYLSYFNYNFDVDLSKLFNQGNHCVPFISYRVLIWAIVFLEENTLISSLQESNLELYTPYKSRLKEWLDGFLIASLVRWLPVTLPIQLLHKTWVPAHYIYVCNVISCMYHFVERLGNVKNRPREINYD